MLMLTSESGVRRMAKYPNRQNSKWRTLAPPQGAASCLVHWPLALTKTMPFHESWVRFLTQRKFRMAASLSRLQRLGQTSPHIPPFLLPLAAGWALQNLVHCAAGPDAERSGATARHFTVADASVSPLPTAPGLRASTWLGISESSH